MPKQLNERAVKYWLTRNTPRASCWAVYTEIEHMTGHSDTKIIKLDKSLDTSHKLY